MDDPAPNCTLNREWVGLRCQHILLTDSQLITCSIERIRHCFIPIICDKRRPLLSLIVAIVILEIIDAPIGECLGVLFLHPQRRSCSISVIVSNIGILPLRRTLEMIGLYRIARKYISQQRNTFPTQAPYRESCPQLLVFRLGIWSHSLGGYRLRSCRWTNSHLE